MVDRNIKDKIKTADNAVDIINEIDQLETNREKKDAIAKYELAALSMVEGLSKEYVRNLKSAAKKEYDNAEDLITLLDEMTKKMNKSRTRARSGSAGGGKTRKHIRKTRKRKTRKHKSHKKRH